MEIFVPVIGYEEYYSVSNFGKVRSERSGIILQPATDKYGYNYYVLSVNGKRKTVKEHRLVAEAFIPNPERKPTVDHINCNKKDNRVENLRWATNKEQTNNPITLRRIRAANGRERLLEMGLKRNFGRKRVEVKRGGESFGVFPSLLSAAKEMHTSYSKSSECANGKLESVRGYVFIWLE